MEKVTENQRERMMRVLQRDLIYFANRQDKTLSYSEAGTMASRIMVNADLDNAAFQHKGTSWLARVIIDHLPTPSSLPKKSQQP